MNITLDKAKVGDFLIESALNSNGQVIIGKGVKLEQKHIDTMKRFGVKTIDVSEEAIVTELDLKPEHFESANQIVSKRLLWNFNHSVKNQIKELAIKHYAFVKLKEELKNA